MLKKKNTQNKKNQNIDTEMEIIFLENSLNKNNLIKLINCSTLCVTSPYALPGVY